MGTITLENVRATSDITVKARLKDGGVAIDWSSLTDIKAWLFSDAQKAIAGRFEVSVDQEDGTVLVCTYSARKPQYPGVNRLIVQAKYLGRMKTYDKPCLNLVPRTADVSGTAVVLEDPIVEVSIEVTDVSSSIMDTVIAAAIQAADRAEAAAEAAEHMVDIHTGPAGKSPYIGENGHWFEWDEEAHEYVDTETKAKGDTGETPDITIGTVTTVEPGTPAGATMTGTPEAPVLNLSIPKGAVGSTPNLTVGTVTTGEPGTPVVVTITGTAEAPVLNIQIPQGMQGNTGSSVEYPFELVNNLTTDDATKALSAAQGKVLDGKVTELEAKVDELWDLDDTKLGGIAQGYYNTHDATLPENRTAGTSFSSAKYSVSPGQKYLIYGNGNSNWYYRLWATYDAEGNRVSVMDTDGDYTVNPYQLTIPEGVATIVVNLYNYDSTRDKILLVVGSTNAQGLVNYVDSKQDENNASIQSAFGKMATGFKYSINIPVAWVSGAYYNSSATLTNQANFSHASVDVSSYRNQPLKIELMGVTTGLVYAFLTDDAGTILQSIQLNLAYFEGVYTIPANAKYFLLSNRHASGPGYLKGGSLSYLQSLSYLVPELGKVTILGDSITFGVGASSPSLRFSTLLCQRLGATENNLGVAGTLLASGQTGHTEESRFVSRATAENLAGSDLIIVFGGTNDFTYDAKAIGPLFSESSITPSGYIGDKQKGAISDTDTFAGALHELINTIRMNCPDVPIVFVTPLNRGNYNEQSPSSFQCNRWGNYLYEFVNAIKEICAFYSIPVCEMNQSNLDFSNAHTASEFSVDTLHPNDKGHRLIADTIYNFILTNVIS